MFTSFNYNNGEFMRSSLLACPHAFSTRSGGVSTTPHLATMNVAQNKDDPRENVFKNRRILADAAGCVGYDTCHLSQTHSSDVFTVTRENLTEIDGLEGDGLVTNAHGIALLIKIADCAPILLYDSEAGVIGILHAGWRGTAAGIVLKGIDAACRLGAERSRLKLALGACIHECCFEVCEDLREGVIGYRGAEFADRHIRLRDGRLHADIVGMNSELMQEAGIPRENIDISPYCTACEPTRFHSHRATGGLRGTMGAAIGLPATN